MGSLMLGKMLFKLIVGVAKATPKIIKATIVISSIVKKEIERLQPAISQVLSQTIKRQELRKIYEEQKKKVTNHPEVSTQTPYVVCSTTVLGNYLSEQDWQDVAAKQLSEEQVLQRIENSFDHELHERLTRATQRVGFVNIRKQVPTGVQQVASYSDGQGHGVRIAINHEGDSDMALDLIGYQGSECHTKREELVNALAEEGITLERVQVIDHNDPDGYQAVRKTNKQLQQQRRQKLYQQQQRQRH